jgi:hypothetical protein
MFATYENLLGCDSADFDGTNDYMTRGAGLTGAADGKAGTISFWCRLDGGDSATIRVMSNAITVGGALNRFTAVRFSDNTFVIAGVNAAGSTILNLVSASTYTASATWLHVMASWNLATAAAHLYVSDVEDLAAGSTLTDDSIDYTVADFAIGALADGQTKFDGCLAEFYLALEYIDLSVATNRAKFISTTGKPMGLGLTAQFPSGTSAIVYQHLNDGEAVANFAANAGTGGDFTITGTLATGSTSPSD